ncbi:MAG TPA: TlpA disulfide reductase family protein [Candidatus Krumholzibacteria bacterium]|nr:TlpA disulfide reductase family protein [Candidatus Krumholzibacteria bacterium]
MTNRKTILAVAMVVVVGLGAVFAVGMNRDGERAASTPVPEETRPLGIPVSAQAAENATLPEGGGAEEVYTQLSNELGELSKQAMASGSPEEQMRIFAEMKGKLVAFRAKFPGTPEALDAAFQLGAMHYSMQQYDDGIGYLKEFVAGASPSDRQKLAYAHFYLAESYKGAGGYDDAEKEYKLILSSFSDVNPRLTSFVQNNMASLESERKIAVGGEPIGFKVKGLNGETLSPDGYKGKVLLIDFWATWCGPCVAEMPNVKSVYKKYHPRGFEIVGISLDQSRDKLDAYIQQQGIEWPQYFDGKWWNNDIAQMYGIKSIPSTLLVDRKGKIRYKSLRGKQLEDAVEKLLAEKA